MIQKKFGILLTNIGTPDKPDQEAVRRYLAEFLADKRVIDYPRWFWIPLLNQVILRIRPARSAQLYENIWQAEGSPLLLAMENIALKLETLITQTTDRETKVTIGMRYGNPSIENAIESLIQSGIQDLIIFPLFPQYSITTTGTTIEKVLDVLTSRTDAPTIRTCGEYHDNPDYISAISQSIQENWDKNEKPERLIFSFHGVPKRYQKFDKYKDQCLRTARLVAEELNLAPEAWVAAFQSRFGPESWLQPYTDQILEEMGREGIKSVNIVAPGFSVDCLETTDELGREASEVFLKAGGTRFQYVPALNDRNSHIEMLKNMVLGVL